MRDFAEYLKAETLCVQLGTEALAGAEPLSLKLAEHDVTIYVVPSAAAHPRG